MCASGSVTREHLHQVKIPQVSPSTSLNLFCGQLELRFRSRLRSQVRSEGSSEKAQKAFEHSVSCGLLRRECIGGVSRRTPQFSLAPLNVLTSASHFRIVSSTNSRAVRLSFHAEWPRERAR